MNEKRISDCGLRIADLKKVLSCLEIRYSLFDAYSPPEDSIFKTNPATGKKMAGLIEKETPA